MYIAVPKTATTFVENFLERLSINDGDKTFRTSRILSMQKHEFYKHIPLSQIEPDLIKNFNFTFAFVRNPFDIVVSWYFYYFQKKCNSNDLDDLVKKYGYNFNGSFKDFVLNAPEFVFRNQISFVQSKNKKLDFIGRYENLSSDLEYCLNKVFKTDLPLSEYYSKVGDLSKYKNDTIHQKYTDYYDDESYTIIKSRFKADLIYFKYNYSD